MTYQEIKSRLLFARGEMLAQAERYQVEAQRLITQSKASLMEEKGRLLLEAYSMQGIVRGIVEAVGFIDIVMSEEPANQNGASAGAANDNKH